MMDAAEILEKGADYIRENGWTQGSLFGAMVGDKIPACCLGAIKAVANFEHFTEYEDARRAVAEVMKEQFCLPIDYLQLEPDSFAAIMEINDYRAKNAAEVIACMEKAAANLREHADLST